MSELEEIIGKIEEEMVTFRTYCRASTKVAAKRCRQATLAITKLGKRYRKLSIAAAKK